MRKIIMMMPMSVDGFIDGRLRELDRHKAGDELHRHAATPQGPKVPAAGRPAPGARSRDGLE